VSDEPKPSIFPPDGLSEWRPKEGPDGLFTVCRQGIRGQSKDGAIEIRPPQGHVFSFPDNGMVFADYGCSLELRDKAGELVIRAEACDFIVRTDRGGVMVQVPDCPCRRVDCTC